jgi:hypothetical protein
MRRPSALHYAIQDYFSQYSRWGNTLNVRFHQLRTHAALQTLGLFDHLVGAGEQRWGQFKATCLGRPQVDHQLVFGWSLNRKISRLFALKHTIDVGSRARINIEDVWSVGGEPSARGKISERIDGG